MRRLFLILLIASFLFSCSYNQVNSLKNSIEVSQYNDYSDTLNIEEILNKPFKKNHTNFLGFNLKSNTLWCKIKINVAHPEKEYVLKLDDALIDSIDVYNLQQKYWIHHQYGFNIPQKKLHSNYPLTVIPIKISKNNITIYYLKIKSRIAKDIMVNISSKDNFIVQHNKNLLIFGLLYGVLIAFIVYNFIIFFITRSIFYLYFSLAVFCTTLVQAFLNGHASYYLFTGYPEISFKLFFIFICLGVFFVTAFSNLILEVKQNNQKIYYLLLQIIKGYSLICIPAILIFNYKTFSILIIILVSFYTVVLFLIGITNWFIKGNKIAKIFTIGWVVYFLGIFSNFLRSENLIAVNWFSTNITFISYLGEIIMFSIALAVYYDSKKKEERLTQKLFTNKLNNEVIKKTQELTKTIQQKNALLTEIHHRVKNNIQIIYSLFNLRERRVRSKEAIDVLKSGKNKLKSMALVHEHLYLDNSYQYLNTKNYFTQLIAYLKNNASTKISFSTNIEQVKITNDQAIPLGLIVTEIITNSIKYAFKNGNNKIELILKKQQKYLFLNINDNGVGFNTKTTKKKSLGISIIKGLVKQLNGVLKMKSSKNGTSYLLKIPIEN